jgi:hypothetical protein
MKLTEFFPKDEGQSLYRISQEQIEGLLKELEDYTFNNLEYKTVDSCFVEDKEGFRYVLKTYYVEITDLKKLESTCREFVKNTVEYLNQFEEVFSRRMWHIRYDSPTHVDPFTFDYVETPSKGRWVLIGRFRGI